MGRAESGHFPRVVLSRQRDRQARGRPNFRCSISSVTRRAGLLLLQLPNTAAAAGCSGIERPLASSRPRGLHLPHAAVVSSSAEPPHSFYAHSARDFRGRLPLPRPRLTDGTNIFLFLFYDVNCFVKRYDLNLIFVYETFFESIS